MVCDSRASPRISAGSDIRSRISSSTILSSQDIQCVCQAPTEFDLGSYIYLIRNSLILFKLFHSTSRKAFCALSNDGFVMRRSYFAQIYVTLAISPQTVWPLLAGTSSKSPRTEDVERIYGHKHSQLSLGHP